MPRTPTILFAGGGSLGHLMPSLAVLHELTSMRPDIRAVFVCSEQREEAERLSNAGHTFHVLRAPRFPQVLSFSFFTFPFLFIVSCLHARKILTDVRPDLVFVKGGSVSVPVCLMARFLHIPVVLHESDSVLSLSTKFSMGFSNAVCTGFPTSILPPKYQRIAHHTGNPVRGEVLKGSVPAGQRITGFSGRRPVVMILGGSQGSRAFNDAVSASLRPLLDLADIIHLTGIGKMKDEGSHARYFVRPTVTDDLPHLYALADIVVSRAGAGVLSELSALKKTAIVVPLTGVAHNHQLRNAEWLLRNDAIVLLPQEKLPTLPMRIGELLRDTARCRNLGTALHTVFPSGAARSIAEIILAHLS